MQVTSRSGQKKGSLRIAGTLELIPARPPSPSIPPALHVGIFAVVRVTSAEESWTNEVKCHEKNAVWIISWCFATALCYKPLCYLAPVVSFASPLSSPRCTKLDLIWGGFLMDKNPGKLLLVNQGNPSNPTCSWNFYHHLLWCLLGLHEMQRSTWREFKFKCVLEKIIIYKNERTFFFFLCAATLNDPELFTLCYWKYHSSLNWGLCRHPFLHLP